MHNHVNTLKIENYSWGMKIAEMANRSLHSARACFVQVSNPCVVLPKFNNWQSQQQEYLLAGRNCQLLDALFLKPPRFASLSSLPIQCRQGKVLLITQRDYQIGFNSDFHLIYLIFTDIWFTWLKQIMRTNSE